MALAKLLNVSTKSAGKALKLDAPKKTKAHVDEPVKHPKGAGRFPSPETAPKLKPVKDRIYTKGVTKDDPLEFTGTGFGRTGLTGES